jgi:hypothetical protein
MVCIQYKDQRFIFSSHARGIVEPAGQKFILQHDPDFLYLDGPDTLQSQKGSGERSCTGFIMRIQALLEQTRIFRMILDQHPVRDARWREKLQPLFDFARKRGIEIRTAAEFRGEENNCLESRRRELYKSDPPQRE